MASSLTGGFRAVAFRLQEQAALAHSDVQSRLRDAVNDQHRGTGSYGYYIDHTGDGESGDCVYCCDGDIRCAPYEMSQANGKAVTSVDFDNSSNVVPHIEYIPEADDDDHYAHMDEAFRVANLYTELPLYERFISKGERDSADEGSFAGKGKSFPILKPGDVSAAVHAMGRAGSSNYGMAQLKANIIRIAKKKGWAKYLPKAWQNGDSDSKEAKAATAGNLALVESAATIDAIVLREARSDYEIKLIAPGKGSSAFYPAEVLRRDGPKVFTAGTHVYLNHPTAAEEASRPEGSVDNLAGVLTTSATYNESHAKGPGLYARMKVFADHAQTVEEKAPHVGMSIRASGIAESGKKRDGLPILKSLTSAESVDVVTKAGAGGMILTEAARPPVTEGEIEMTESEVKKMIGDAVSTAVAPFKERALSGDAFIAASKQLAPLALKESAKQMVIDNVLARGIPTTAEGALDAAKFKEAVDAEAKRIGAMLSEYSGGAAVVHMGAPTIELTETQREEQRLKEKRARKEAKRGLQEDSDIFGALMGNRKAGELAAARGAF